MAGAIEPADQIKSPERLLAEAEQMIKKLEAKLADQQEIIRDEMGKSKGNARRPNKADSDRKISVKGNL